jgi:NADH-quinone oxidoreductase subunit F
VGGGNAAVDSARTALRLGAKEVHLLYRRTRDEMPAQPTEIAEAIDEGVQMHYLAAPKRIAGKDKVEGITCTGMQLSGFDENGRRRPLPMDGRELALQVDTVILAVGQEVDPSLSAIALKVSNRGRIVVDPGDLSTSLPGVYAGGDAVLGPATVIDAIAQGLQAARSIDEQVRGIPATVPTLEDEYPAPPDDAEVPEKSRRAVRTLSVPDRLGGFAEVALCYSAADAQEEASRCLRCHFGAQATMDEEDQQKERQREA